MQPTDTSTQAPRPQIDDCWNRIGVRGDMSCPKLTTHIHCRNCPVHEAAATLLLDARASAAYVQHWTEHIAEPKIIAELDTDSVVVFRVGLEWLALSTLVFKEIASVRTIHSLPHRRSGMVLGLANIRGELLVCISLGQMLNVDAAPPAKRERHALTEERLLVLQREGSHAVFPVEQVHGIQRFHRHDLKPVPATVARASATYTRGVFAWKDRTVGLLDDELLFYTIDRSLASATKT